jgi:uncharacterized membrane protein YcjF (UPF0283 family)
MVHCDVSGGMEQEGRTSGRTSIETFEAVHTALRGIHHDCAFRAGTHAQDTGVLLWQHELHESFSEDHLALLQEYVIFLMLSYSMAHVSILMNLCIPQVLGNS